VALSFVHTCHSQMGLRASQACKLARTTTCNFRCPERRCIFLIGLIQKFDKHNSFYLTEELVTHVSCQYCWPTDCTYTSHGKRHNCSCVTRAAEKLKKTSRIFRPIPTKDTLASVTQLPQQTFVCRHCHKRVQIG
jgi:hypothetical protein